MVIHEDCKNCKPSGIIRHHSITTHNVVKTSVTHKCSIGKSMANGWCPPNAKEKDGCFEPK